MSTEYNKNGYVMSTDKLKLQLEVIHGFLTTSYWAKDVSQENVKKAIENSVCFGIYEDCNQIGFARVITDYARIAYLADVFVLEPHRGRGLSKWLMHCIMAHPDLQNISKWILVTADAHSLYQKYGFKILTPGDADMFMIREPDK